MRSKATLLLLAILIATVSTTFLIKLEVREEERQLGRVRDAIQEEMRRGQTLRADLSHLTKPDRLTMQAEQVGMHPLTADRIHDVTDIGRYDQLMFASHVLPVALPSGKLVELRLKPLLKLGLMKEKRR